MSDQFWKRFSYIIGLLPIGALFGVLVFVANIEIKDLDLWLHLAMGKYITIHKTIPSVDILSFTISGKPWVNHEWLFQVILFNIFDRFGPDGLLKMQMAIVTITMLILLFLGYSKERQLSSIFLLLIVFLIYQTRFTIRPDIFSLLFFALYIFVLALHIDKRWAPVVLFVIQVLWSNIHGFFFFGPLFVFIGLISEWIRRHVKLPYEWNQSGGLTDDEFKRLKFIFIMVIVACLINPGTFKGAWYPIGVFFSLSGENQIFFKHIQELQKPITLATLTNVRHFIYFKLIILLSFVSFIFNRRRIDISALLFWIVFLVFSLKAARNTAFFAFAAYLVIITNLLNVSFKEIVPLRFTAEKFRHLTAAFIKFLLLIWIVQYGDGMSGRGYYDFDKYKLKSEFGGVSLRRFPQKAADFLIEHKIKGNFFNDFNSGAYLLGRCYPDVKVFIDGRTEVYGGAFFKQYLEILEKGNGELLEELVTKYNITGAFLNASRQHIPSKILNYLYDQKDWKLVYFNYDAVIFLRDNPENKEWIDQFEIDLSTWKTENYDLVKLGPTRVTPYHYYFRAYMLEGMGFDDKALQEAQAALSISPSYAEAHEIIGKVHTKVKNYQKAFEHFRIVAMLAPHKKQTQFNLALTYMDLKEYEHAIKQYTRFTQLWPNDPKGYFFLTKAYAYDQQYDQVLKVLKQAHQKDPGDILDILDIGDVIFQQKEYKEAKNVYEMALKTGKTSAKIHEKLGNVYLALEDVDRAKSEFQRALEIEPENEAIQKKLKEVEKISD